MARRQRISAFCRLHPYKRERYFATLHTILSRHWLWQQRHWKRCNLIIQSGILPANTENHYKTALVPDLKKIWMSLNLDFWTKNSCEEVGNEVGVWLNNSFGWLVRLIETYSNRGKRPVQHGRPGLGGRVWTFVRSSKIKKILSSFSSTRYQSSQPVDCQDSSKK